MYKELTFRHVLLIGAIVYGIGEPSSLLLTLPGLIFVYLFEKEKERREEDRVFEKTRQVDMLNKRREGYVNNIIKLVEENFIKIELARSQLTTTSPMGIENTKQFDAEMISFLTANLSNADMRYLESAYPSSDVKNSIDREYRTWIREAIFLYFKNTSSKSIQTSNKKNCGKLDIEDPQAFEARCAQLLQEGGWVTSLTPRTGDYGVDIIARQKSRKVVVQCKRYRSRVGPSAVQEVAAGLLHYGADAAIVVSEAGYTTAAVILAQSNRVLLMHSRDLSKAWEHCVALERNK